ncbi:MAG: hypothetical protein AB1641_09850 [Thermodesulfobacteriota bacterium]
MTPGDLIQVIERVGAWPLATILLVVIIGPWLMSMFLDRAQERRHKAVAEMYDHNVKLVQESQDMAKRVCILTEDVQGALIMNAQAMTSLAEIIKARQT